MRSWRQTTSPLLGFRRTHPSLRAAFAVSGTLAERPVSVRTRPASR
jgi:hypothetical protein